MARHRVAVILGTRPEAVKLAPIVGALRDRPDEFEPLVVATGQHREMLHQILAALELKPDIDLDVMHANQPLPQLTCRILDRVAEFLADTRADLVVVQGDTTTAFAAALASFYVRIPVAHVEAGLRTDDLASPFPEEANRRLAAVLAAVHLAPTPHARAALLAEGVPRHRIVVTGNPVVDALRTLGSKPPRVQGNGTGSAGENGGRLLLLTAHRRESWGDPLEAICMAIGEIVDRFPDVHVVYPVHLNPRVDRSARAILGGKPRVTLLPPLDYLAFLDVMRRAYLVLTDSGGVQEEAPSLGKPVLVLRDVTERPEGVAAGVARLVGTDRRRIVGEVSRLLTDRREYEAMRAARNPYGDGHAAERIAEALARWLRDEQPLLETGREFGHDSASPPCPPELATRGR